MIGARFSRQNNMIEIALGHLDIDWPINCDPDELTLDDLDHPIFEWAKDCNMDVQFEIRWQEVEDDDGTWDEIWSTDPRLFAVFEDPASATAFALAWEERDI